MQIGFLGALALLLITLKLTAVITISWLWVLAPLWIPLAIAICVLAGVFVVCAVSSDK